ANHAPPGGARWARDERGRRVGCVLWVAAARAPAQLGILLVPPSARGQRRGGRLVDECITSARQAGYQRMRLWTNPPLAAARQVYLARGFTLTAEEPHHSFGADLTGQVYELAL